MEFVLLIFSIANFVCFIFAVIQMFSKRGAAMGCLGLIIPLGAYIWGWYNFWTFDIVN